MKKKPSADELTDRLHDGAHRVTGQRRAILDVLSRHPHPMTNKQIHEALTDAPCDLATIYRSMKLLVEKGLVERFDFGDGVARFELSGHHSTDHHHHLICRNCDDVVEIEECFTQELQRQVAKRHGYAEVTHKLEFFGLCPNCQSPGTSRRPKRSCGC